MKRTEIFEFLHKIDDPQKDYTKILSNLHYTHFFLMDRYNKLLAEFNLTASQANVLGIIDYFSKAPASLEQIKELVLEPNADVSRTVSRLVEKGFVEKVINKENRRKVSIVITEEGFKLQRKVEADPRFQLFTSEISLADARTFIDVLKKLRKEY
jgi:DNA-binding MarR family transcriptional regulator